MNSAFQQAVLEGDTTKVKFLLRFSPGIQVNQSNKNGLSPLLQSCSDGHLTLVHVLLDNGADLHAVDQNGWSSLHIAAAKGHKNIVGLLIDSCADLKVRSLQDERPIDVAKTREIKMILGEAMLNVESKSRNSLNLEETWGYHLPYAVPGCRASIATSSTDSNASEDSGIGMGFDRNRRGGGSLKLYSHKERERLSRVTFLGSEVSDEITTKCVREDYRLDVNSKDVTLGNNSIIRDEESARNSHDRVKRRFSTEPSDCILSTVEESITQSTKVGRSSSFNTREIPRRRERTPERRKKLILRTENTGEMCNVVEPEIKELKNIRRKTSGQHVRDLSRRKTFTFGEDISKSNEVSDVDSVASDISTNGGSACTPDSEISESIDDFKFDETDDAFRKRGSGGSLRLRRYRKYLSSFFSG